MGGASGRRAKAQGGGVRSDLYCGWVERREGGAEALGQILNGAVADRSSAPVGQYRYRRWLDFRQNASNAEVLRPLHGGDVFVSDAI